MNVAERLASVKAQIAAACQAAGRSPDEVRLVAVSKRQPLEKVIAAHEAGHRAFGENYVQALAERVEALADAEWHMIGHLQTNKGKLAGAVSSWVHTVDSVKVARALLKAERTSPLSILIQVRLGEEDSKSGVEPDAVAPLVESLRTFDGLQVRGLMTIPPPDDTPRRWFSALRETRDRVASETGMPLSELSMGMSGDFSDAILEGATVIRVGTAIFGPRDT